MTTAKFSPTEEAAIATIRVHMSAHASGHDRKAVSALGKKIARELFAGAKLIDKGHDGRGCSVSQAAVIVDVCAALLTEASDRIFDATIAKGEEVARLYLSGAPPPHIAPDRLELFCAASVGEFVDKVATMTRHEIVRRTEAEAARTTATVQ